MSKLWDWGIYTPNVFIGEHFLNVRSDTIKPLEEKLCDIELGKDFSGLTPKARATVRL